MVKKQVEVLENLRDRVGIAASSPDTGIDVLVPTGQDLEIIILVLETQAAQGFGWELGVGAWERESWEFGEYNWKLIQESTRICPKTKMPAGAGIVLTG